MSNTNFVKVFAGAAVYHGLVPADMVGGKNNGDEGSGSPITSNAEHLRANAEHLRGVDFSALYLLQHLEDGCRANCAFCIQARDSRHRRKSSLLIDKELVRIPLSMLTKYFASNSDAQKLTRVCIQTVYNPNTIDNLLDIVAAIRKSSSISLTACCIPVGRDDLVRIKAAGVDYITINYEAATPETFALVRGKAVNGPYRWERVERALRDSLEIFGPGHVGSHMLVGLGETQREAVSQVELLTSQGIYVSLFAFTPVANTALEHRPRMSHSQFHQIQLASYLVKNRLAKVSQMRFDDTGTIVDYGVDRSDLESLIDSGSPFRNSGCPGCNRVYYETNPGEQHYTYPRDLRPSEVASIRSMILPS